MTTLPAHTSRAIHNKGMQAVYGIAAEYDVDVTDVIALLVTTSHTSVSGRHSPFVRLEVTTPSQPFQASSHAPAADTPATQAAGETTDGEVVPPPSTSPSVEPIHQWSVAPGSVIPAPFYLDTETIPEAPKPLPDDEEMRRPAEAKTSAQEASADASGGMQDESAIHPATPSPRISKREQVRACHIEHPDWTSHQIAEHLGFGVQHVQIMASHLSLKLPRAPRAAAENMRDKVLAVIAAHPEWALRKVATEAGCSLGTAAKWAKEGAAKPPEAEQTSDEPQAETAPDLPPVSLPSERLPPPIVRPTRSAPSGRFYLRDKTTGHFVHQSLQPNAAGDGPMMTFDRKWAWYDTLERYRGAKKRWPQIEAMRKEASGK